MGDLTEHFDSSEVACNCGCGFASVSTNLIARLEQIRSAIGSPLHLNSVCRCEAYNAKVGGLPDSAHTRGTAADVRIVDSATRYKFLQLAFTLFPRVGVYQSFVHVDVDETLPPGVCWTGKGV